MTAIIDGVTVIGTPEEIDHLITLRAKKIDNVQTAIRDMLDQHVSDCQVYRSSFNDIHVS